MKTADYVERWECVRCGAKSAWVKTGEAPENWFVAKIRRNGEKLKIRVCCVSCLGRAAGRLYGGPWGDDWRTYSERQEIQARNAAAATPDIERLQVPG